LELESPGQTAGRERERGRDGHTADSLDWLRNRFCLGGTEARRSARAAGGSGAVLHGALMSPGPADTSPLVLCENEGDE